MDEWDRHRIGDRGALSDDVFAQALRRVIEARDRGALPPKPDARITREAARCYAEHRGFGGGGRRRSEPTVRCSLTDDAVALLRAHGFKMDDAPAGR